MHDARRPQDRNAADNAEARIPGLLARSRAPPMTEMVISASGWVPCARAASSSTPTIIGARGGVDRRPPRGNRQAGLGHGADPVACLELESGPCRQTPDLGPDMGAMGHIRVVAGVFYDASFRKIARKHRFQQWKGRFFALGQRYGDVFGEFPVRRAKKAAFVAAVAQQPVVQPRRNSPAGFAWSRLNRPSFYRS